MTLFEEFQARVRESSVLSSLIDQAKEEPYGVSYRFDGYIECAIVSDRKALYDLGDISLSDLAKTWERSPESRRPFLRQYEVFDSLQSLLRQIERQSA